MTVLEKEALRISKQKNSCKKCIYCHGEWCRLPYNETCAEGIYKALLKEENRNFKRKYQ